MTPVDLQLRAVRIAVATHCAAHDISQKELAASLGLSSRKRLSEVVTGGKGNRRVAAMLADLRVPICTACGWATCAGCGGNGAGKKSSKKDARPY